MRRPPIEHEPTSEGDTIMCFSCMTPNGRSEAFCRECGAPIGGSATLDHMGTIQAQGFMYRRLLEGKPKPIVLIGVWLLHLPALLGGVYVAIYLARNLRELSDLVFFWIMVVLSLYCVFVLYRVTKNYLTLPERRLD